MTNNSDSGPEPRQFLLWAVEGAEIQIKRIEEQMHGNRSTLLKLRGEAAAEIKQNEWLLARNARLAKQRDEWKADAEALMENLEYRLARQRAQLKEAQAKLAEFDSQQVHNERLCSSCHRRERHFGELCKRCANEQGVRPVGKVGTQ